MASIAKLLVSLGADISHFETDMKRAERVSKTQLKKMERQAKQLNDKWNRNFKLAGAAVAAGLVVATKAAADFEKAMAEVSTLVDSTPEGMKRLGDEVKKMSVEFGQAPVDQAKALYQIISAGASDAATQMEHLEAANKLAVGGVTDVATAADGLTTVLNAYEGSGMTATNVSDILFQTMRNGKTTIGELSQSIGNVATIAAQTGVGFDQLGAAVGTLTKKGINTTQAMDAIRGVLSAVLKQSDQSVKMADELGVAFNATALEAKGLHGFLRDIADSGATSEQLSKLFGRVEGLNAVMALGSADMKEFTNQLDSMGDAAGQTEEAVSKMAESTAFKAAQAAAAFETLKIEIGQKFLASVSNAATLFVKYFDKVVVVIENLVYLLTARLAIAGVAALESAAAATKGLATAMAIAGGPIGIVAAGVALLVANFDRLAKMDNLIGSFFRSVGFAIHFVNGVLIGFAAELYNAMMLVANSASLFLAPFARGIATIANALQALIDGDWARAGEILKNAGAELSKDMAEGIEAVKQNFKNIGLSIDVFHEHLDRGKRAWRNWNEAARAGRKAGDDLGKAAEKAAPKIAKARAAVDNAVESLDELDRAATRHKSWVNEIDRIIEDSIRTYEDWNDEQEESERKLTALLDAAMPLEAALRDLGENVDFVHMQLAAGNITAEQAARILEHLAEQYGDVVQAQEKTAKSTGLLTTALDEGVRILERSFSEVWSNLLDGSDAAFDSIKDGFKSLLANLIHQATTQKIVLNIQQGLGPGGGGINFKSLGGDLAQLAGVLLGGELGGGGQYANIGAALGGIAFGGELGAAASMWMSGALGVSALAGPIGMAIVGVLGAVLGGALGGLFDKDRPPVVEISGFDTSKQSGSDKDTLIKTLFGDTFLRTRRVNAEGRADIALALEEFDNAIASILDSDHIGKIQEALDEWGEHLKGNAISMDTILNSRFAAILDTFEDGIESFVMRGFDLAEQMDRLQIAVAAQKIVDQPIFQGRTVDEFLRVVEAFRDGSETITDAFNEVIQLLDVVASVQTALREYADSNLGKDYADMINEAGMSLADALAEMQSALMDAIVAFDGSPNQLQQIGLMVNAIREGEIRLLTQIDNIQQGINANLDSLEAKIRGLTEGPQTAEQIFREANALIGDVLTATDSGQIAEIERRFTALINSLPEADQIALQTPLLNMIEGFREAVNLMLDGQRQDTIDNGEQSRELVDIFLNDIGDPLDVLANSNQTIAAELGNIDDSIQELAPTLEGAIRRGFGAAQVNVTVVVDEGGLVNE